ncbi:MAG: metal-dependent transcriptional regulator [Chloroflexi bacterium]|nr:metal-dependent transcriptional regulator [Chloroflexota bacterium]
MIENALNETAEEYLKAIYKLQHSGETGKVSLTAIARRMGVSVPAVISMVKRLAALRLIQRLPYQGVAPTPAGDKIALRLIRHHRLMERFMVDAMGFGWDQVDEQADRLEHVISEAFADRVEVMLGYPRTCPHGDPIPAKDGSLPELQLMAVADMHRGQSGPFRRVGVTEPEVLSYLGQLGFKQDVPVTFLEKAPFQGPVRLRVGENEVSLGAELASQIYVEQSASA